MAGSFVADVRLDETAEVLQVPVLKPKAAKKLLQGIGPRIPILGSSTVPCTDDTLEQFLQHTGTLFGKDPTKWEKVGETKTDITEQDGKRIIRRTGMFTGTELHLWEVLPYFDPRLPPRQDQPHLDFSVQRKEIVSNAEWQQLIADQPWSSSRRRQMQLSFLQAKLEAGDDQLQCEGAHGMWELSINKAHQAEMELCHLQPLVQLLMSTNIEVASMCAAAVWGLSVNERSRSLLLQLSVVDALLQVARQSLELPCVADPDYQEAYLAGGKCAQSQRNLLQARLLGSLSVLLVDKECRKPLLTLDPGSQCLFELCHNLPGYADKAWAATRRETAAKAITSLIQRDHDARSQLISTGGIGRVLGLLDSKGPGHSRVQFCMASLLATLVLDDSAMELIKQRGEGHLIFEAMIKLLTHVMTSLKFTLALPGVQFLGEGMTQAEIAAAVQKLRNSSSGAGAGMSPAVMQAAARRLSQEAVPASNAAVARRLSADAQGAGTVLQEGSSASGTAAPLDGAEQDALETFDMNTAVLLAEACAQALWGATHYSLEEQPLHITKDHVKELGKLSLDCIIISEVDLGRVCHCISATLASLASNEQCAGFIMDAPNDSVLKAVLTLLEVEEEEEFSNAGFVRAAASTCLAFLAGHPLGARGDICLTGPFRQRLLDCGAMGALLKAALASTADDPCDAIIQQTAAVGIMYLSTMAGAVDPAELAMYAALMTSNTNVQMVEYLMAGMWVLLKVPSNRKVLGGAFKVNPASSKLARGMMDKLNDTIDMADVNETAEKLVKSRTPTAHRKRDLAAASSRFKSTTCIASDSGGDSAMPGGVASLQGNMQHSCAGRERRPTHDAAGSTEAGAEDMAGQHDDALIAAGRASSPDAAELVTAADGSSRSLAGGASLRETSRGSNHSGLLFESSFGALAAEADTMEEKLRLVDTKRKSALFTSIMGESDLAGGSRWPSHPGKSASELEGMSSSGSRVRVQDISEVFKEGSDSKRTLDTMKSMSKSMNKSLNNLDQHLGSELDDDWGLDVLVRVGETWLPRMAEAHGVPRGSSLAGVTAASDGEAQGGHDGKADVPLLKLFEFLTASLCLYVIEEEPANPLRKTANVYSSAKLPASRRGGGASWWTVQAPMVQAGEELSPLMARTMHILLTVLQLRLPTAWKSVQLSIVMLWNAAVQSGSVEHHQIAAGICTQLLDIANSRLWPPTLRDMAAGHLQFLMETHENLLQMGNEWQQQQQVQPARQSLSQQSGKHTPSSTKHDGTLGKTLQKGSEHAPNATATTFSNQLPFDLAAILNPRAAPAASKVQPQKEQQQHPADPLMEVSQAAGAHAGLVPVMCCFVSLIKTSHPLLELCGARGIARLCFAGSMGAPSASQLLMEAKATAAAAGAIGALVDLLRSTAYKFMVLEDGGQLPVPPQLTGLADQEYHVYERELGTYQGVLELLTAQLAALMNLSTLRSNQPKIVRSGLPVLLKANISLYQVISCRAEPSATEMGLLDMLAGILSNLASHPDNRTHMYRAELAGTAALDRVLEGPVSPEPQGVSAAVFASRLTGTAAPVAATAHCSPNLISSRGGPALKRSASPQQYSSPSIGRSMKQVHGDAAGASSHAVLSSSLDSALSAAAVLRPKVVFPPITRSSHDPHAAASGKELASDPALPPQQSSPASPTGVFGGLVLQVQQQEAATDKSRPLVVALPSPSHSVKQASRSPHSRGGPTSVAGQPGSPMAAPDAREQFLIWMDGTFAEFGEGKERSPSPRGDTKKAVQRRTNRRQLWDESGEWLQPEPESAQALQRLLCRPLKHLWQDSPEARARAGNARWSPAVSEYRQANLKYPMQNAAAEMLTAMPPAEAAELLDATAQLTTTGRSELIPATLAVERPATSDRQRGRVPLTVLEPAASAGYVTSTVAAATAGSDQMLLHQPQQQQSTSGSAATSMSGAQDMNQMSKGQEEQVLQQTALSTDGKMSLKVILSPQRPRTIISFENRVWSSDGSRPSLTIFPHAAGAKVSEGLFQVYSLPNGRQAFMYYDAGNAMDEADVEPLWPPPRPTTVPLALQQSMPLANVLGSIAKPPGNAPPFVPYKPVPRLVPLPDRHTLVVARPESKEAASWGHLRNDNLQLILTAQAVSKHQTTTSEEDIKVQVAEEREPWSLPGSIFKSRAKESDARAFYDGGATLDKMFERDWARACGKEKFTSMLVRENKGNSAGKSDKAAMQEVHEVLKKHYQMFYSTFVFYTMGGNDPYHMPLNAFTSFLDDAGIPDPDSLSVKRSDCDTIFIVCNFQPDKNSPDVAVNDEHAMMRFEFMEALVRLAIAKYGKGQTTDDLGVAVELLFERNLIPRLPAVATLVSNDFRTQRLYTEEVDMLLKQHQGLLKALYSRYRLKPAGGGLRPKVLKLDGWLTLMSDAHLVDSQFTLADATLSYLWSRMYVIDEIKDYARYTTLTFVDFLEALGRVADATSLPTASDLDAAGYPSIFDWALDKERLEGANNNASNSSGDPSAGAAGPGTGVEGTNTGGILPDIFKPRLSARFGAPKHRPLYAKLELLLDLIFRRLYWDPAQPDSVFSYDALCRMVKKIDKDLGP